MPSGCGALSVIAELKRRHLWPVEASERAERKPKRSADDTRRYLLEVWRSCGAAAGTHVETYLRARCITVEVPPSIRFHPRLKHSNTGLPFPTMVAAVQAPDRSITGLHRTFLRADGEGKAQVTSPRKMLGSVRGGAVRLAAAGPELALGEGIETCLAYVQLTGTPTWAAPSAPALMTVVLPPLPSAETVYLLIDVDPAGEQAAAIAASRLDREGRRVKMVRPSGGKDINDAMRAAAAHG
jgi:hypothetical protein